MTAASFEDFYQVPDLEFDIVRLRNDLKKILDSKKFNTPGVTHFGAIPLNQIPNDKSSIEGNNIRGKYWTIADETGKEVSRDCLLYTSPSPRDRTRSRMPSSA